MTHPTQANYRSAFLVLIGCVAAAVIVTFSLILFKVSATQDKRSSVGDQQGETISQVKYLAEQIRSCTDTEGICFKRNLERQAKILGSLFDQDIAIAACADQPGEQTEKQIRACAKRIVKASRAAQSQQP